MKQNSKVGKHDEQAIYEHPAHPVRDADPAAGDGICGRVTGDPVHGAGRLVLDRGG